MAKKDNTHPILQEIKNTAKEHQSSAKAKGENLVYGHALDQASKQHGYKDWNTACGMVNSATVTSEEKLLVTMSENLYRNMRGYSNEGLVGSQRLSDFGVEVRKIFYTKRNHLMDEYGDLLNDPLYQEIPYEIETIEEMGLWVKKQGGALFYPTASIADLKNLTDPEIAEIIEANINTKVLLNRNGLAVPFDFQTNHNSSFIIGPSGRGMSFYIEDLIRGAREENPSFSKEEALEFVRKKYHIQTVLDVGQTFDIINSAGDDDSSSEAVIYSAPIAKMEALLKSLPDNEIARLVHIPILIQSAISRGHRAYQNEMIEKTRMIRDEASKRGLNYEISYRDDSGILRDMFTEGRKYGGVPIQKSKAFVRSSNDKHAKAKFSARGR